MSLRLIPLKSKNKTIANKEYNPLAKTTGHIPERHPQLTNDET